MSIENDIKRIADTLDKIYGRMDDTTQLEIPVVETTKTVTEISEELSEVKVKTPKEEVKTPKEEVKEAPITKKELNASVQEQYKASGNSRVYIDVVFKKYDVTRINELTEDKYSQFLLDLKEEVAKGKK